MQVGLFIKRYEDYFNKAQEAERLAELAENKDIRKSFRMIARGWRDLAKHTHKAFLQSEEKPQPSALN